MSEDKHINLAELDTVLQKAKLIHLKTDSACMHRWVSDMLSGKSRVYWHNVTPQDNTTASTAPANLIYTYCTCMKGIDTTLPPGITGSGTYTTGDVVWVKRPHGRCTTRFKKGKVMTVYGPHSVLVDRVPRHVKDVLHAYGVAEQLKEKKINAVRLRICKTLPLNQSAVSSWSIK